MSVYIPGMEMPKCDIDCPIFTEEICPIESVSAFSGMTEELHPDCPLVPVPDHGDLIDKSGVDVLSWTDGEYGTDFEDGVLFVLDKLDELPVIIPAEGEDYEVPAEEGTDNE